MVLQDTSTGMYYITGTTDLANVWEGKTKGFHVYSSPDLANWRRTLAWEPPEGCEWDQRAWGAVILPWEGRYLMLGALYSAARKKHGILSMVSAGIMPRPRPRARTGPALPRHTP